MPREAWSDKRERQYDHVKESELERGRSEDAAERIAAATVNQTRTAKGETGRARTCPPRAARARRPRRREASASRLEDGGPCVCCGERCEHS